jgi:hypothetical protein
MARTADPFPVTIWVAGVSVNRPRPAVMLTGSGMICGSAAAAVLAGAAARAGEAPAAGRMVWAGAAEVVSRHAASTTIAMAAGRAVRPYLRGR